MLLVTLTKLKLLTKGIFLCSWHTLVLCSYLAETVTSLIIRTRRKWRSWNAGTNREKKVVSALEENTGTLRGQKENALKAARNERWPAFTWKLFTTTTTSGTEREGNAYTITACAATKIPANTNFQLTSQDKRTEMCIPRGEVWKEWRRGKECLFYAASFTLWFLWARAHS